MKPDTSQDLNNDAIPWNTVTTIFGTISGLSLFLSIVYDMGYFEQVGLSFADMPTTISDHVRSALLWVPQAVSAAFGYCMLVLMKRKFDDLLNTNRDDNNRNRRIPLSKVAYWAKRAMITAVFMAFFTDIITGGILGKYGPATSTIVITYIVFDIITRSNLARDLSVAKLLALSTFPVITIIVYNTGASKAIDEQRNPKQATIIFNDSKSVQLNVLRYLDRGVLASNRKGNTTFYKWEDIKMLSTTYAVPQRKNWACTVTHLTCKPDTKANIAP